MVFCFYSLVVFQWWWWRLAFDNWVELWCRWLLAVVGLLDLVVIAGCVGLIERERGRERSELFILFDGVVYIILMSYMFLSKKEKK